MTSERITDKNVKQAFDNHIEALATYGLDIATGSGFRDETTIITMGIDMGSKTNGIAYRIYWSPTGQSGHYDPRIGSDFLGMTAREAYETLTARTRMVYDLAQAWGIARVTG